MKKKIIFILSIVLLGAGLLGNNYYQKIFGQAILENNIIFIEPNDSLFDIEEKITSISSKPNTFLWVASKKNFSKPKSGRYVIKKGMSNNDIVNLLRSGNQTPLKISFNNQDTLEKFASRIAEQLQIDSTSIITAFTDKNFLNANKLTKQSVLQICIPNSYEFYWTVSADGFRDKLLKEYNRFWNSSRLAKAKALKLTQSEVITLASIVQKETAKKVERPIVAGLYLNRLKNGWPLQADPTIIYAKQQQEKNIVIKRVLFKYIEETKNSPYNTYKNRGLPPSLIAMPDISSIDGVLNAQKHNYFYMCVNVDKLGYHSFAETSAQHRRNAAKYHNWLNRNGINK